MNFHPLVIYLTTGALILCYAAYLIHFIFLRQSSFVFYYALTNHVLSVLLTPAAVFTGLSVAGTQYVQQKAPFIFLFPHKWMGIVLTAYTVLGFLILWIKQRELDRRIGIVFSLIGLGMSIGVVVFGWLLRLIFF